MTNGKCLYVNLKSCQNDVGLLTKSIAIKKYYDTILIDEAEIIIAIK